MFNDKTKKQFLEDNGFNYIRFMLENEHSTKNLLNAMDEYSEYNCDQIRNLYEKPMAILKPLEDQYRKENPRPDGKFYLPDTTEFFKWIVSKFNDNTFKQ